MARCPFATWKPLSGAAPQSYIGGPFRIVHHTTEGSTAAGAMATFQKNNDAPHFTVDAHTIYQHIDTGAASRALRHSGPPETNRLSAVQIEVVGFAGQPKDPATLAQVAKLCRWLEPTHGIPKVWPAGPPNPPKNGQDPGRHNRSAAIWSAKGGHYGHSQVPNNIHWDPGYTAAELAIVMGEPAAAPA